MQFAMIPYFSPYMNILGDCLGRTIIACGENNLALGRFVPR